MNHLFYITHNLMTFDSSPQYYLPTDNNEQHRRYFFLISIRDYNPCYMLFSLGGNYQPPNLAPRQTMNWSHWSTTEAFSEPTTERTTNWVRATIMTYPRPPLTRYMVGLLIIGKKNMVKSFIFKKKKIFGRIQMGRLLFTRHSKSYDP